MTLVDPTNFPTGEVHPKIMYTTNGGREEDLPLWLSMEPYFIRHETGVDSRLNDWLIASIMACEAKSALNHKRVDLFLPYLPYSRQDRRTAYGESFSLKVLGDMLAMQPIDHLFTVDVHSDVAAACIPNLVNIDAEQVWFSLDRPEIHSTEHKILVIPDHGAFKRLSKFIPRFKDYIIAIKTRNPENGHIEFIDFAHDNFDAMNFEPNFVIIDDICDGGATFAILAQKLRQMVLLKCLARMPMVSIELAVTHGVFTKGYNALFDAGIDKIHTTNSFPQQLGLHNLTVKDLSVIGLE